MDGNQFSEREKDVVRLLLQAKSNKQIALELGISNRTVEFHLGNIYAKLGAASRAEATLKLTESRLWETPGTPTRDIQVKSTVADVDDLTENGFKPILRRIAMKKLYYIIGGLLAVVLIAVVVIVKLPAQNIESASPTPTNPATGTHTNTALPPTVTLQTLTETPPTPLKADQLARIIIPPHTVNGYTATIESYYVDISHVTFQVSLTDGKKTFRAKDFYQRIANSQLYDEHGAPFNASGGDGPAIDPALCQFNFLPATFLKGDRFKGQFAFDLKGAPDSEKMVAQFRFDFDLPIDPDVRFNPKQTVTANKLDFLLDSVTVVPTYTQIYVCFPYPSLGVYWTIGNQTVLQIDGQQANPNNFDVPFDSQSGWTGIAEPYWISPIKNGRCVKIGFPIGSSQPTTLTLTIPQLERLDPNVLLTDQLLTNYPGLSEKQAYYKFLEERDGVYKGPWTFVVKLTP